MCNGELKLRAIYERDKHGGIRAAARAWGKTHGMIARAINGGNSPTLRRLWDIPKNPPVPRLIINGCPPALKERYETARGEMSRTDFLEGLLDLLDGVGKLRY